MIGMTDGRKPSEDQEAGAESTQVFQSDIMNEFKRLTSLRRRSVFTLTSLNKFDIRII